MEIKIKKAEIYISIERLEDKVHEIYQKVK